MSSACALLVPLRLLPQRRDNFMNYPVVKVKLTPIEPLRIMPSNGGICFSAPVCCDHEKCSTRVAAEKAYESARVCGSTLIMDFCVSVFVSVCLFMNMYECFLVLCVCDACVSM